MRQINLDHNGRFYLYADSRINGYGFPVKVNTIPECINVALDHKIYKFVAALETVRIQIPKGN